MNALLLGSGYVAQAYAKAWGVPMLSRKDSDYTDVAYLHQYLQGRRAKRPQVVVNCAGMTGRPNIDECETKKGECVEANIALPVNLSRVCAAYDIRFVHISSGCIYQGLDKREDDAPDEPMSFYSRCKWMAEQAVTGYVLRIRMPFGYDDNPRSFISKIMRYPRLISEENSLTFLPDLVKATAALLDTAVDPGVYNVVNDGAVTHRDIVEIFNRNGHPFWSPEFIRTEDLGTLAPRSNCTLNTEKLSRVYRMPNVRARLVDVAKMWEHAKVMEAAA